MFKLLALMSVLISVALAQNASSTNSLIPSGISSSCGNFLNVLNADSTLASCLSTMTEVTTAFAPGSPTPSSSEVTSALTNLCNGTVTSACPQSNIRQNLTDFVVACSTELNANPVAGVRLIYDVLYTFLPLQIAVCSKDDAGNWCVNGPSTSTREFDEDSDLGISEILALFYMENDNGALPRRDQSSAFVPNVAHIQATNLPFVFFTANLSAAQLCVPCLRQVLTAYINFESDIPYAYPLNDSSLLSAQSALYNAVQSKCPANFLTGTVEAAGGLAGSWAIPSYGAGYQHIIALVMGAVTLIMLTV